MLHEENDCLSLSAAETLTLLALEADQGVSRQSNLIARLGCSPAHVSGVVERLRARGLINSERLPTDRRRQAWRITNEGRDALSRMWRAWHRRFELRPSAESPQLLDALSDRLETLERLMRTSPVDAGAPYHEQMEAAG